VSSNKIRRERLQYAERAGVADAVIEMGGRHQWLLGTVQGKPIAISMSSTPSDRFAEHKFRADLRRAMRTAHQGARA
jgi:hypothetical protein